MNWGRIKRHGTGEEREEKGRFGCESVNWADLAQDKEQWRALTNTEMTFVSHKARGILDQLRKY